MLENIQISENRKHPQIFLSFPSIPDAATLSSLIHKYVYFFSKWVYAYLVTYNLLL